jgi:subtilisin-like proprotein convertase family protein
MLAAGAAFLALTIGGGAHAATLAYDGAGGALPDRVDFQSTLTVGDAFSVQDVDLTLVRLTHSFWADLDIYLSHGGVTVRLTDDNGGSSDPNGDFTFDDEAALGVGAVNTTGGIFRPLNALSAFDGLSSAGDWTLRIFDDANADAGALTGWKLSLAGAPTPGGVPEPATWAMMLMGFGGLGAVLRRRRAALAAA